jgi:hypothetical protein
MRLIRGYPNVARNQSIWDLSDRLLAKGIRTFDSIGRSVHRNAVSATLPAPLFEVRGCGGMSISGGATGGVTDSLFRFLAGSLLRILSFLQEASIDKGIVPQQTIST